MSEFIKRDDVFEALGITDKSTKYGGDHSGYNTLMLYEIKGAIDSIPTAEPKVGEWIENETTYADNARQTCECSVCGKRSPRPLGDYCRWCGAKMERSE